MRALLAILLLLVPSTAWATDWGSCATAAWITTYGADVIDPAKVKPGSSICYDLTNGLDSKILDVGLCDNFDVIYEPDMVGAGVAISVVIRNCIDSTAAAITCGAVAGVTLSGTPPNTEIYGAAGQWIYVDGDGTIGLETPRVLVHCNGPR
jgi:hypothetical protein